MIPAYTFTCTNWGVCVVCKFFIQSGAKVFAHQPRLCFCFGLNHKALSLSKCKNVFTCGFRIAVLKVLAGRLVRQIACVLAVRRGGEEGKLISAAVLASAFAAEAQLLCTSASIVLGVQLGHHRRRTEKPDVGWLLETTACLPRSAAIENSTSSRNFSISVTCICASRKAQKATPFAEIDKSNQAAMSTSCDDSKFTSPTAASRAQSLADEIFGCNGLKQLVLVLAHLCDCNAIFDHLQSIFKNKRRRRTVYHQGLC
ncbi:hypothetical protein T02_15921 [Trichinella nativa]|uniref:Uncharacterized protein n=1 Tax=Trichinella nativa TaxID=6335 RepID=A0A0V1KUV7_9BILA|nr:hypothetical protein T02_15921 [Trichinella nativa]